MKSDQSYTKIHAFLLEIGDALRYLVEPTNIMETMCEKLAQFVDADQVAYAEIDEKKGIALVERDWNNGKIRSNAGIHMLEDFGHLFVDDLKAGNIVAIDNISTDERTSSPSAIEAFRKVSISSFINVPLIKNGVLVATLSVHNKYPKIWSFEEIECVKEAAERTWSTLERSKAEKALRESEARIRNIFDKIDEGYCLCELIYNDHKQAVDYRFLEVNSYFEKMTGLSDAAGKAAYELIPGLEKLWLEAYAQAVADGQSRRFENTSEAMGRVFDVFVTPTQPKGQFVVVFRDITARKKIEHVILKNYNTYLNLIEKSPFGIYLVDDEFKMAEISAGGLKAFENIDPLIGRDFSELIRIQWPKPLAMDIISRFKHTLETGDSYQSSDLTEKRADTGVIESYDWKLERVVLPNGRFGVVCYFYDISERRQHEQHIQLLLREVNHRSKNLLGVVLSVARQTVAKSPKDFISIFEARVQALSAAQDILVRNEWRKVSIQELVYAQLSHFKDVLGTRVRTQGPLIEISSAAAQTLGMAMHELSTNAAKYGALSDLNGIVDVSWDIYYDKDNNKKFVISWVESDGPEVNAPAHRGFGSTVIYSMTKAGLNADVSMNFEETGLKWQLECLFENMSLPDAIN